MRSHTGAVMAMGKGCPISMPCKQKTNTKSSTGAGLVGVGDALPLGIWCKYSLEDQGYQPDPNNKHNGKTKCLGKHNTLYQDNTSSIRLEGDGKAPSTKRARHLNTRYSLVTDKSKRGEIPNIGYCPTDGVWAGGLAKPLQGPLPKGFRNAAMGCTGAGSLQHKARHGGTLKAKCTGRAS